MSRVHPTPLVQQVIKEVRSGSRRGLSPIGHGVCLLPNFFREQDLAHADALATIATRRNKLTTGTVTFSRSQDAVVASWEREAAGALGINTSHVEPVVFSAYTYPGDNVFDFTQGLPHRAFAVLVFLNSLPFGPGQLEFPTLNLRVRPSRGDALLLCLTDHHGRPDERMMPTLRGVKDHPVYMLRIFVDAVDVSKIVTNPRIEVPAPARRLTYNAILPHNLPCQEPTFMKILQEVTQEVITSEENRAETQVETKAETQVETRVEETKVVHTPPQSPVGAPKRVRTLTPDEIREVPSALNREYPVPRRPNDKKNLFDFVLLVAALLAIAFQVYKAM